MSSRRVPRTLAVVTSAVLATCAGACAAGPGGGPDAGRVDVVSAFYPLQFVAQRVGGDAVTVTNLAKPGTEPHDLELTPTQIAQVSEAELIVYLKGFQPAVDEAVAQEGGDRAFDVAGVQPLLDTTAGEDRHEGEPGPANEREPGGKDPHVWLDPNRLATIGDRLAERLGRADPGHATDYTARAAALRDELQRLDREYVDGLKTCQRREIVVSHAAFGYLAERYQLTQIAVSGLAPEAEPSARRLAEVVDEAKKHRATTIFFETLVSPKVAGTIAREIGVGTAVLDPIEGLPTAGGRSGAEAAVKRSESSGMPPGSAGDYFSVMRTNLAALTSALGCS